MDLKRAFSTEERVGFNSTIVVKSDARVIDQYELSDKINFCPDATTRATGKEIARAI
jgi:hypothetical protein